MLFLFQFWGILKPVSYRAWFILPLHDPAYRSFLLVRLNVSRHFRRAPFASCTSSFSVLYFFRLAFWINFFFLQFLFLLGGLSTLVISFLILHAADLDSLFLHPSPRSEFSFLLLLTRFRRLCSSSPQRRLFVKMFGAASSGRIPAHCPLYPSSLVIVLRPRFSLPTAQPFSDPFPDPFSLDTRSLTFVWSQTHPHWPPDQIS